jgi:flavin-binding monooxygenase-like protein
MTQPTIVIGAGPAGLATAACLKQAGCPVRVLEAADTVGASWRTHYDRLHLHTDRRHSALPGLRMPRSFPRYPSRDQVVAYLESYASHFDLEIAFDTKVTQIVRTDDWCVHSVKGSFSTDNVVVCTGFAQRPNLPEFPGQDNFAGPILHSSAYKIPDPFVGKSVLVVGFGNSGCEIALDLAEAGVDTHLSVRGPVNVVPRDILGIPILTLTILQQWLPYALVDKLNRPIIDLCIGDIAELGLPRSDKGPMAQVIEDHRIPLLDIGTLSQIRAGQIRVRSDISQMTEDAIVFNDQSCTRFDAIILATGYKSDLRTLLPGQEHVLDQCGRPVACGRETDPGLFFANFQTVATGQLRQCGIEAKAIARAISG